MVLKARISTLTTLKSERNALSKICFYVDFSTSAQYKCQELKRASEELPSVVKKEASSNTLKSQSFSFDRKNIQDGTTSIRTRITSVSDNQNLEQQRIRAP